MQVSNFLQSNMALNNSLRMAFENSSAETWEQDLKKALEPFGAEVANYLDHLTFG